MAIFDVNPTELIIRTAEKLKAIDAIQPPEWAKFVRTGHGRERPPVQDDWWHIRAASVLRKLVLKGPIGVNKLRVVYGNRKNYGMATEHFVRGSGNIIRKILQQLEKAGLASKVEKEKRKGRKITPKGISLLDSVAAELLKENPPKQIEVEKAVSKVKVENKLDKKQASNAEKKEEKKEAKKNETKKSSAKKEDVKKSEDKKDKKKEEKSGQSQTNNKDLKSVKEKPAEKQEDDKKEEVKQEKSKE